MDFGFCAMAATLAEASVAPVSLEIPVETRPLALRNRIAIAAVESLCTEDRTAKPQPEPVKQTHAPRIEYRKRRSCAVPSVA
jgi:hypothetical protein